jgi:MFS family permease
MTYRDLLRAHGGTVAFGFCLAFLSSFGQTFFISLSGPDIRAAFGLSNGAFGTIYSAATLASGFLMIWAGGILDRVSTRLYAAVALGGLAGAALCLSVAPNLVLLGVSLFALRLFGQGMLSHAAVTSTARLADAIRGRAVGVATLGFSAGEALLPSLGVALIGTLGWAGTWRLAGAALLILLAGAGLVGLARRRGSPRSAAAPRPAGSGPPVPGRRAVLTDWRFLIFIPTMIGPPAIVTGYFFHQRLLAERQGWALEALALSVSLYALAGIAATMTVGSLVDRFRGTRVSRVHLLPLAAASLVLIGPGAAWQAPLFFPLMGATAASNSVVVPAVLAELFGTERLGTIRALAAALMVAGSAITPGLFGFLFDAEVAPGWVGAACALYLAAASILNLALRPGTRARP